MSKSAPTEQALPISSLSHQTQRLVNQVQRTRQPLVFTRRGKSAAVLMDADDYRLQQDRLELMKHIAQGKRDIAEGRTYSQQEVETLLDEWLSDDG